MRLVFATNNKHKLDEARQILGNQVELLSLKDVGIHEDIPEDYPTLEDNSRQKAQYIFDKYGYDCIADDTGLEINALDGEPGVYSARYAGEPPSPAANRHKVLQKMTGIADRTARFRTVVTLITNGNVWQTEGIVRGRIEEQEKGDGGFGYDCLFTPEGYDLTFAQLGAETKNSISHRAKAMQNLALHLQK